MYERHRDQGLEILSVSIDARGAEAAREWHARAGCTFRTAVDQTNLLPSQYSFKYVPNAFFYDEEGVIVAKQVLFWISNPAHAALVDRFLEGTLEPFDRVEYDETVPPEPAGICTPRPDEEALYRDLLRLGADAAVRGDHREAAEQWRMALRLDPGNYGLRSQIWALEHPERFVPTVDLKWQEEQLARELAAEADEDCGPDGCRI